MRQAEQSTEYAGPPRRISRNVTLCACGCGRRTELSDRTSTTRGVVKGQPLKFIKGHNTVLSGIDLSGAKFGKLLVVGPAGRSRAGVKLWHCLCDCGEETVAHGSALTGGHTKSCGCLRHEGPGARHGMCRGSYPRHPVWVAWSSMVQRCTDENATNYSFYGGRGISVCDRWRKFENFRDDMLPSWFSTGTLERVDNDGGYGPGNCRWATKKEQARNRRSTRWVTVFGETLSLMEAVEKYGVVKYGIVRQRVERNGWSLEDALTTPTRYERHT